ncbi:MAG: hypothetical protein WAL63_19170 [Solirubrobacteraceae bacterium]
MKRLIAVATALGVLVTAGAAYAALNTYTVSLPFTTKKAGTASKPVPIGFTQNFTATGTAPNRTAVLLDVKTKIYGLKVDGKDFPTCTIAKIAAAHTDAKCPKGAAVAKGYITSSVGSRNNFAAAGSACDPVLDVWNAGQGKLAFFFVETPTHVCLGGALSTGSVAPYPATYRTQGKYLVQDTPIPPYIGFPLPGLAGSLETEHLVWKPATATVKGKKVTSVTTVACTGKKRPYSETFKATLPTTGQTETTTVSKTAACS